MPNRGSGPGGRGEEDGTAGFDDVLLTLAGATDSARFERLLMDAAVDAQGAVLADACLLARDSGHAAFVAVRSAASGGAEAGEAPPAEIRAAMLPPLLARAWASQAPELGDAAGAGVAGADRFAAVALASGLEPWALLAGRVSADADPERAIVALARLQEAARAGAESVARADEVRRLRRRAAAQAELARAVVSSQNLAEVLRLAVRLAATAGGALGSALWLEGPAGLRLEATHGPAGQRESVGRALQALARATLDEHRLRAVERPAEEALLGAEIAASLDWVLVAPLLAYGRDLGAIAIYDRSGGRPAPPRARAGDPEFLAALADQLGAAVDQAARFDALREAERERTELRGWIQRLERLSRLGEDTLETLQAARNPVASIGAFVRRMHRALDEEDPNREPLEIVLRESERLERLLEDRLARARDEHAALRVETLNAAVQEVLQEFGETLVRRRVRLLKRLAPDLPELLVDGERVRAVLRNILLHALDGVPVGGRVRLESRRVDRHVAVDISHDGPRRPGDLIDHLFAPFAAAPGAGETGLALAQRIVREHGGEVRMRTEAEWSSVISFTLPIAGNEDRRSSGDDRRARRADRRAGAPSGARPATAPRPAASPRPRG